MKVTRRELLQLLAAGGGSLLLGACSEPAPAVSPTATRMAPSPAPPTATSPAAPSPAPTTTVWLPPEAPRITPNADFYTMKYHPSPPPEVDLDTYRLLIDGEVDTPLSLSLAEIQTLPARTVMRTLECISNPVGGNLIGNATWTGISMAELLRQAGLRSSAHHLRLESLDGYHTGIPVELALAEPSLLVYQMNGEPLPAKHGFPLRALWPGRYGQKQPKWLERITVQRQPHTGHFEGQGWSDEAIIKPNSRIEQPPPPPRFPVAPPFYVAGVAFTTDAGLERVEVSLDDGNSWQEANLLPGPSPLVWTHWWLLVEDIEGGVHRFLARVTDNLGNTQTRPGRRSSLLGQIFPDGTEEMHRIVVQVKDS